MRKKDTRQFLTLDRDGGILITSADKNKGELALARVATETPNGPLVARLKVKIKGELAHPPIVSPVSYAFVLRQGDGTARVTRLAQLPDAPPRKLEDLGEMF